MKRQWPIARGSFIQLDLAASWTDIEWTREFNYMRELDMKYLVIVAAKTAEEKIITVYPSKIVGTTMMTEGRDILDLCLRNAEKLGINVFIGPNFSTAWWKMYANNRSWLIDQMEKDNIIADEIFSKYCIKYPHAFYGWYWPYEIDNLNFKKENQMRVLAEAINTSYCHLKAISGKMPILISPFMKSKHSSPDEYADMWKYIFRNTCMGYDDIFCPQDSVGAAGIKIDELDKWFEALGKAAKIKNGLKYWANTENFDVSDWTSATIDRFIKQMSIESKYVEDIITFSYNHYYSPNNIDPGFHRAYLEYVNSGWLESKKLQPPGTKVKRLGLRGYNISWEKPKEKGICGYLVYCNDELIFKTEVKRKYGGKGDLVFAYDDLMPLCLGKPEYKVVAFDFAGNRS